MKKVLSIVLSIAMVICLMPAMAFAGTATASQAAAAYNDTEGTACEGAVNVLSALEVVSGYEDGSYKPEQVVTRAEMAKLIVTALGVADYATATTSKFTDMSGASWAIPYVEYASNLNIVNGYGNGLFGPSDTVTYEQALTMVVRALGYTDEAKEMNGTWPAIYVQKASALGLLENVTNGGANGANRGDVAIILYNALDIAEVYVDADGVTQNKKGAPDSNSNSGYAPLKMMDTLNKNGETYYGVLTDDDADSALCDVRSYVGAAGKITKNKDDKVIALGDIKTVFLTGDYTYEDNEFVVGDTTYTLKTNALKYLDEDGVAQKATTADDGTTTYHSENVPCFLNGALSGIVTTTKYDNAGTKEITEGNYYALNADDDTCTLACVVSGKTITAVYSAALWDHEQYKLATSSDISNIKNNHKINGYEIPEDDNGDIDYAGFVLEGVSSVEDIVEDNVLEMYYTEVGSVKTLAKLSVGTEVVEGDISKYVDATAKNEMKVTIDGTQYKSVDKDDDPTPISGDSVGTGDTAKLYLNYAGKIAKIEKVDGTTDYAVIIKASGDLSFDEASFQATLITADGSKNTYDFEDDFVEDNENGNGKKLFTTRESGNTKDTKADTTLTSATIVKLSLNNDGEIDDLDVMQSDDSSKPVYYDLVKTTDNVEITKAGYYDGKKISSDAPIFTVDVTGSITEASNFANETKGKWGVTSLDSVKDSDKTPALYVIKDNVIEAMIIPENVSSSNHLFGVLTDKCKIDDEDYDYEVTMLVNGEEKTYKLDANSTQYGELSYKKLYKFTLNSDGELDYTDLNAEIYLNYVKGDDETGIAIKNDAVTIIELSLDSDMLVYVWDDDDDCYEVGYLSDIENAESDTLVYFYDAENEDGDNDNVASIAFVIEFAPV